MTNAPKLLPCPFCGSDHIAQECGIGGEPYMSCVDCGANVEGKAGTWNTRALDPRVAALVEAASDLMQRLDTTRGTGRITPSLETALDRLDAALAAFKGYMK